MDFTQIILLALIQGITEFLPISSSAHLILPSAVLGWQDQGLAFDVAVHVGSLVAVIIYFYKDIWLLVSNWSLQLLRKPHDRQQSRLAWWVILATIPAGFLGLVLDDWIALNLRSILVIATTTIVFGVLLAVADRQGRRSVGMTDISMTQAVLIGFGQAIALIPGTSRSGITMTVGLFLGLTREAATRFSFLLSIPLIFAAGLFKIVELIRMSSTPPWGDIALGAILSGVSAYICIRLFLGFIERMGFMPFVWYRMVLGLGLLVFWFIN